MAQQQTQQQTGEQAPAPIKFEPNSYDEYLEFIKKEGGRDDGDRLKFSFGEGLPLGPNQDAAGAEDGKPAESQLPEDNSDSQAKEAKESDGVEDPDNEADTASDGDGEPGNNSLPKGVKRRIARAQKRNDELQKQNEDLAARLAALEAKIEGTAESEDETETDDDDDAQYLAPNRDDYDDASDYIEDLDAFENGLPLIHDPKKSSKKAAPAKASKKETPKETAEPEQDSAVAEARALFEDIQELVESKVTDAEMESGEDLWKDFQDLLMRDEQPIRLSDAMVRYMADSDDSYTIVQAFVEKPVLSRRIARRPVKEQIQALEEIINRSAKGGDNSNQATNRSSDLPVFPVINGANPQVEKVDLNGARSYGEYQKLREQLGEKPIDGGFTFRA